LAFSSRRRRRAPHHRDQIRCAEHGLATPAQTGEARQNVSGSRIPRSVRWRGDLWTTPREETRLCGRVARTGTRRIVGAKVRRVARATTKVLVSGPVEGPRGPDHGNVLQGRGGVIRRGGEKPRGRHADGNWRSHLEGCAGQRRNAELGIAGSRTLRSRTMEGRSLDNPTRGNPALPPGRKDRNASGKSASRSGGSREP